MKFSTFLKTSTKIGLTALGFATLGMADLHAQIIDLTPDGTAIVGLNNTGDYLTTGYAYSHGADLARLTDGTTASPNLFTWADTYQDGSQTGGPYDSSYAGFTFSTPTADAITSLTMNFMLIGDGGWFGSRSNSSPLVAADLNIPSLQYTLNGTDWITLSTSDWSSNYVSQLTGQTPGFNPTLGWYPTPQVTFTLDTPLAGVEGIRLIGPSGGASGFLAIPDERVFGEIATAPEPTTWAMLLLGVGALILGVRRRREA